jgi:hypothetical protein
LRWVHRAAYLEASHQRVGRWERQRQLGLWAGAGWRRPWAKAGLAVRQQDWRVLGALGVPAAETPRRATRARTAAAAWEQVGPMTPQGSWRQLPEADRGSCERPALTRPEATGAAGAEGRLLQAATAAGSKAEDRGEAGRAAGPQRGRRAGGSPAAKMQAVALTAATGALH